MGYLSTPLQCSLRLTLDQLRSSVCLLAGSVTHSMLVLVVSSLIAQPHATGGLKMSLTTAMLVRRLLTLGTAKGTTQ